jgi:hypothetical protein
VRWSALIEESVYRDEQTFDGEKHPDMGCSRRQRLRRCLVADAGLFIGWGEVVRGRESEAVELFNEVLAYYGRLQEEGTIEAFEPVFLEPHGGDLNGFILIRGDAEKLAALRVSEEFIQYTIRATLHVENFGVVGADLAERLQRQVEYYTEQIGAIA